MNFDISLLIGAVLSVLGLTAVGMQYLKKAVTEIAAIEVSDPELESFVEQTAGPSAIEKLNKNIQRFEAALEQNTDPSLTEGLERNLAYYRIVKTAIEAKG